MNKQKNPKVSIIIPVYNTEEYLKQCLDSIINQTLKDIEIILINDGSTDNSGKICDEYALRDTRIRVIHQENQGVSVARNKGIETAQGEYLGFIDSDDKIDLDFYEKLYNKAIKTNSDMVKANVKTINYNGFTAESLLNPKIIEKQSKWYFYYEWWSAIYKTQLVKENNIRFPEEIIFGEDSLFLHYIIEKAENLEIINDTYYYYQRRKNSTDSLILQNEKINSCLFVYDSILKNINKLYKQELIDKEAYSYLYETKNYIIIKYFYRNSSKESKMKCLENIINYYNLCLEKNDLKIFLLKTFPLIAKNIYENNLNNLYRTMIKYKNYEKFKISNIPLKTKIIYIIYLVLLKLGIKDIVKKILQKLGFRFQG